MAAVLRRLMDQLAADCALLEELRVMDYSLLLGVHYRSTGWTSSPPVTDKVDAPPLAVRPHPGRVAHCSLIAAHAMTAFSCAKSAACIKERR
jgi:hypothetical protein